VHRVYLGVMLAREWIAANHLSRRTCVRPRESAATGAFDMLLAPVPDRASSSIAGRASIS
jgi:hypothetical protein